MRLDTTSFANAVQRLREGLARFREMRARTSHTYEERIATLVAAAVPEFLAEAEHLLAELERRLA